MRYILIAILTLLPLSGIAQDWLSTIQGNRSLSFQNPRHSIQQVQKVKAQGSFNWLQLRLVEAEAFLLLDDSKSGLALLTSISQGFPTDDSEANLWFYTMLWYASKYQNVAADHAKKLMDRWFQKSNSQDLKSYNLFMQALVEDLYGTKAKTLRLITDALSLSPNSTLYHRISIYLLTVNDETQTENDFQKYEEAINYFESRNFTMLSEIAYYNRAMLFRRSLDYKRSNADFLKSSAISKALKSENAHTYAMFNVARNYHHLGDYIAAEKTLKSIEQQVLNSSDRYLMQDFLLLASFVTWYRQDTDSAQKYYLQLIKEGSDFLSKSRDPELQEIKALIAQDNKDPKAFDYLWQAFNAYRENQTAEMKQQYLQRQIQANLLQESLRNENLSKANLRQQKTVQWLIITMIAMGLGLIITILFYLITRQQARFQKISRDKLLLMAEKELLEKELLEERIDEAKMLQKALVSSSHVGDSPEPITYKIYYEAAEKAGGDWYGIFHDTRQERIFYIIGDVTGHSLGASMLTAAIAGNTKACFDHIHVSDMTAHECLDYFLSHANRVVYQTGGGEIFMSMQAVCIDLKTLEATVCNAGHNSFKFLYRKQEKFKQIFVKSSGILGLDEDMEFFTRSFLLGPGDLILLYTDGLIENGPKHKHVNLRRIIKNLPEPYDLELVHEYLVESYHQTIGNEQGTQDDCCFIVIKINEQFSPVSLAG